MTPARRSASPKEGVTDASTKSEALAGLVRFLPPTAAEVGRAAALCFQDTDTDEQIACQLGIVRRTLARWKQRPEFMAAIAALQVWQEMTGEVLGAVDEAPEAVSPEQRPCAGRSADDLDATTG